MDFGSKIKKIRYKQNISQLDMALMLGVNRHYLSRIENNMSMPSAEFLIKLADVFNISIDSLLEINVDNKKNIKEKKEKISKITKYCNYLSNSELDFLVNILEVMVKNSEKK